VKTRLGLVLVLCAALAMVMVFGDGTIWPVTV
jgi:hypothetical protein